MEIKEFDTYIRKNYLPYILSYDDDKLEKASNLKEKTENYLNQIAKNVKGNFEKAERSNTY